MKKFIGMLCLPFVLFANLSDSKTVPPLVVGTTSGYAPFVSLSEQGDYEGFDVDVAKLLAEKLGRPLVLKDFGNMPGLMLSLKQGKADMLIWAISITEERQRTMELVYYQGEEVDTMPVLFWKEIPEGVRSFEDLTGKVCVEAGTFQESVVKKYPQIQMRTLDKISDVVLELKYGKSRAACIDPALFPRFKAEYPELQMALFPVPSEERSFGNGICISQTNPELVKKVQKAVDELRKESKLAELEQKWGLVNP
jgi:polar amino acid transport system substrate-binding protein